jgi:hypothetical protein
VIRERERERERERTSGVGEANGETKRLANIGNDPYHYAQTRPVKKAFTSTFSSFVGIHEY